MTEEDSSWLEPEEQHPIDPACYKYLGPGAIGIRGNEMLKKQPESTPQESIPLVHSDDGQPLSFRSGYRIVVWGDKILKLSIKQAKAIEIYHQRFITRDPWVSDDEILVAIESDTSNLKNIFKKKKDDDRWRLITRDSRVRGYSRLNALLVKKE